VITGHEVGSFCFDNQIGVSSFEKFKHDHPTELLSQKYDPAYVWCVERIHLFQHAACECLRADTKFLEPRNSMR
jgi:hypothetical protein